MVSGVKLDTGHGINNMEIVSQIYFKNSDNKKDFITSFLESFKDVKLVITAKNGKSFTSTNYEDLFINHFVKCVWHPLHNKLQLLDESDQELIQVDMIDDELIFYAPVDTSKVKHILSFLKSFEER